MSGMEWNFLGFNRRKSSHPGIGREKKTVKESGHSGIEVLQSSSREDSYERHQKPLLEKGTAGGAINYEHEQQAVFPTNLPQLIRMPSGSAPHCAAAQQPQKQTNFDPTQKLPFPWEHNDFDLSDRIVCTSFHPNQFVASSSADHNTKLDNQSSGGISFQEHIQKTGFVVDDSTPTHHHCGSNPPSPSGSRASGKLTIFYADDIYIYDNVSSEKAELIMSMAAEDRTITSEMTREGGGGGNAYYSEQGQKWDPNQRHHPIATSSCDIPRTISQARKASLLRFLEKRKNEQ